MCVCAQSLQSCLVLCDPINFSPPGFSAHGFSRQEYWSGLPRLPPEDLPEQGTKAESAMSPTSAGGFFTTSHLGSPSSGTRTGNALQACLFCHQSNTTKIWSEPKKANDESSVKTSDTQGFSMPTTSSIAHGSNGESLTLSRQRCAQLPA